MFRSALVLTACLAFSSLSYAQASERLRYTQEPREEMPWAMGGHLTWWNTKDGGDGFGAGPTLRLNGLKKFAGEGNITYYPELETQEGNATLTTEIIAVTATALYLIPVRDTDMDDDWQPYVGAGIGYYKIDMDIEGIAGASIDVDNEFGFHGVVGMDIWATERLDVPIQVRYAAVDFNPEVRTPAGRTSAEAKLNGVSIWVGLNYRF